MHLPLALLLLALGSAVSAQDARTPAPAITVSTVKRAALEDEVRASGLIAPVERVLVQPQIEGQVIDAVEVEVGDWVEAGDVLARLSDTALILQRSQLEATRASAEASIAQARAQLLEAETLRDEALRERDRAERLAAQGATTSAAADSAVSAAAAAGARTAASAQGLIAAEAQLRLVDAQIADVELQLRRTDVTATVSGSVTERNANVGAIASMAGLPLFTLIRDGALELRADVAEQDVLRLAAGQPALIGVAGAASPLPGVVHLVEPTVDETSRLGRVRITIENPDAVRAGMFAEAVVTVAAREAVAAPVSAVQDTPEGSSVLMVRDGTAIRTPVVTGIRDGGLIEIVEGLMPGDVIVTKAAAFVRDGDRITPVPAEPAGALN